ncbi:MAG: hypothetical protein FWC40_00610 [Proteobacteria bacterium]|nr:hypothetical protein [Pseudomonadota bacterium]
MTIDHNEQNSNDVLDVSPGGVQSASDETGGAQDCESECQGEVVSSGACAESEVSDSSSSISKKGKRERALDIAEQGIKFVRDNPEVVRAGHSVYKVANAGVKLIKFIRTVVICIVILIILAVVLVLSKSGVF